MSLEAALHAGLTALGQSLSATQEQRLLDYLVLLGKWNHTYNLTAIHEPERMLTHHLLDSLAVLPYIAADRLLDVGSGGGLPGIPLAVARPDLQVTLLDASQKKTAFTQQVAIQLGLQNVTSVHGRVEDYPPVHPFPLIISRAFSDLSDFVRLTGALLADGGHWLAMKGAYPGEEIARLKGVRVSDEVRLKVPGLDAERCLITLERSAEEST